MKQKNVEDQTLPCQQLHSIYEDTACSTDLVSDTPFHTTANCGVLTQPHYSTCTVAVVEMTMNYRDDSNDREIYLFIDGQKERIDTLFVFGGARAAFGI